MTATAFPVAPTAEAALHAPTGFAEREREAQLLANGVVELTTRTVGPAFASRDAASEAYSGLLEAGPGWCSLSPVTAEGEVPPTPASAQRGGPSRWPARPATAALWRLQVRWWRSATEAAVSEPPIDSARRARRGAAGAELDARALGRLVAQPLRPVRPQQPLDIGLFEVRAPEAPDRLIADE